MNFENPEGGRFHEEWTLESKPEEVDSATQKIIGHLHDLGWSNEETEKFELAISEAIANAVVHGNKGDVNKKVTVGLDLTKDDAEIVVTDEGSGFDPEKIPDPRKREGLRATHGRGIFLMVEYSDNPEFVPGKGQVILRKHRGAKK